MEDVIQVHDQFYILATASRAAQRTAVLKHDDTFALFDTVGDVGAFVAGEQGLYHEGTRYLSRFQLRLNGQRPLLAERARQGRQRTVRRRPDESGHSARRRRSRARPRSRPPVPRTIPVGCDVARAASAVELQSPAGAGVAHLRHRRGLRRHLRSPRHVARAPRHALRAGDRRRDAAARLSRPGWRAPIDRSRVERGAGGRDAWHGSIRVRARTAHTDRADARDSLRSGAASAPPSRRWNARNRRPSASLDHARAGYAVVESSSERFNHWLRRSAADLRMLVSTTPYGEYPYAGVPWFSTPFGRDGIVTAFQTLWINPRIARGVLEYLAATQADHVDARAGRRTGKDPARDPQQRDGAPRRSAVRPLLRQRGRDAAVRHAGRCVLRSNRRSRVPEPAVAARRAGARLD